MERNQKALLARVLLTLTILLVGTSPLLAQWEPDVRLTTNDSTSKTSSNNAWCIAASGDSVHAVWWDHQDGNDEIYYKRSTNGGVNWGADIRLTGQPDSSYSPAIAVSGSTVHVIWVDTREADWDIYYKRSLDGGSNWGTDTDLTGSGASAAHSSVAAAGSYVHLVWDDGVYRSPAIYYKRTTDGGANWSGNTQLTNRTASLPSVAVSGLNVHLVWEDNRDGNNEIYYKRSTDGGANWGSDIRLTNNPDESNLPSVAVSGTVVHTVWQDARDGNYEIYYKRSTDNGLNWGSDYRLSDVPNYSGMPSISGSGPIVHVVWYDYRDGNFEIYHKRSTDRGSIWDTDTRLTNAPGYSWHPSIAASGSKVHVVWYDTRDGNYEVYYKRNPTGNSGIEEGAVPPHASRLTPHAFPNPFTSFATIPGHSSVRFALYDIAGRRVGVYKGDRIGEGLSPGVYFLVPATKGGKPLRIVKIR